jgi:hypothetical protein
VNSSGERTSLASKRRGDAVREIPACCEGMPPESSLIHPTD